MNCSFNSFKNRFPELGEDQEIDLSLLSDTLRNEVLQWTDAANKQAIAEGFNKLLYRVSYEDKKSQGGHTFARDSVYKKPILNLNPDVLADYDRFDQEEFIPDEDYSFTASRDFLDSFDQDVLISDEALLDQDNTVDYQFGDVLFSPMPFDADTTEKDIFDTPVTFREWKQTRINLLERLEKSKQRLLAKKDKTKLADINLTIKALETEISEFDETDPNYVHDNILEELEALGKLLNLNEADPVKAATILETNQLRERIQDLKTAFYDEVAGGDAYYNFHKGLNPNQLAEIEAKIGQLDRKYMDSLNKLLFNIFSNNEIVMQQKKYFESTGRSEDFNKFVDRARQLLDPNNKEFNIDGDKLLGKNFLGAASYDSLLAEILVLTRDINASKEAGVTFQWRNQLRDAWDKIKGVKIDNEFFADNLFQSDEFGTRTERLINYINPSFYSNYKILGQANRDFLYAKSANKPGAYKDWATLNKMNVDYIQLHKTKAFRDKYKDVPQFKEFIDKYSETDAEAYENELRSAIGDIAFETELDIQSRAVLNYLEDSLTNIEDYHKNPLRFLENYYSDNFDKPDPTTAGYLLPTYVKYIPSLSRPDYYNAHFKHVESLGVDGFKDFYISAKNLLNYTREAAKSEDINVNFNDIITLQDSANREVMKDLNGIQRVGKNLLNIAKQIGSEFYQGNWENPDMDKNYERKFNSHYSNYGSKQQQEMSAFFQRKSYSDLLKLAEKEGMKIPDKYKEESPFNRAKVADSLAKRKINKSISLDLFKRISYGASIAESINTRRSVSSLMSVIKDYADNNNVDNSKEFLETWEANNILQPGYLMTPKRGRIERKKLKGLGKNYTEAEKELKELYQEELRNLKGDYNFTHEGMNYVTRRGKFFRLVNNEEVEVSQNEIEENYGNYIKEKINNLGKYKTVGSLMYGLSWNMFKAYLWVSLPSGLKNRLAGYNQNNQAAASNLYGYNMDDLVAARRLLGGSVIRKTLDYVPGLLKASGLENTRKAQQVDILLKLAESLGLLENVMQDIDSGDGLGGGMVGQDKYNKFKEVMSDFAMNNPEFHNQMEILVAMMINTKIKKIDGTEVGLYDTKTGRFPFDPKTMQLLPEFRTQENIDNWEKFTSDKEGNAPQNVLIQQYKTLKHKLHGNYDSTDKIGIQSTMTGRAVTSFMKWSFENLNNQWGTKKISIATAEINIKGRKVPLLERFPLITTHLMLQNVAIPSIVGTAIGLSVGIPVVAIASLGVTGVGMIAYMMKNNIKNISCSWSDLGLSFDYLKEVLARTLKTTMLTTSRGLFNPLSNSTIESFSGITESNLKNRNLDERTRRQISESAQEVADKLNMAIQFQIIGMTLKALVILMTPGDDEEKKVARLDSLEGNLKYLINIKNSLTSELEKWTDPIAVKDSLSEIILWRFLVDSYNKVIQAPSKYNNGDIGLDQMTFDMIQGVTGPGFGLPRQLLNIFNPSKSSPYSDNRVYDNTSKTFLDDYLLNSHKKGEAKYKPLVTSRRKKVRIELENIYRKKLREEFDKAGRTDFYNMDDMVKNNVDNRFKKSNLNKSKNSTYEKLYNSDKWDSVIEEAKKDTPTMK